MAYSASVVCTSMWCTVGRRTMTIASSIREGDNSARGRQLTAEQQKYQLVIPNGCAARGAPGRNQNPWARHAPFMSASPTNRKDLAPVQTSRHLVAPGARPGPCQRCRHVANNAKEAPCTAPRRQMEMGGRGPGGLDDLPAHHCGDRPQGRSPGTDCYGIP